MKFFKLLFFIKKQSHPQPYGHRQSWTQPTRAEGKAAAGRLLRKAHLQCRGTGQGGFGDEPREAGDRRRDAGPSRDAGLPPDCHVEIVLFSSS